MAPVLHNVIYSKRCRGGLQILPFETFAMLTKKTIVRSHPQPALAILQYRANKAVLQTLCSGVGSPSSGIDMQQTTALGASPQNAIAVHIETEDTIDRKMSLWSIS